MPDRSLDSLSSAFQPKAFEVLARLLGRGVPCLIVQTSRTEAEHAANLAKGTSGTSRSLHLPRRLRLSTLEGFPQSTLDLEKADATDIVPWEQFQLHGPDKVQYDATDPAFGIIGEVVESVPGLRWGGRWLTPYDPGHFELVLPIKAKLVAEERRRPWPTFRTT